MPRPTYTPPPNPAPSLGDPNFSANASGYLGWFPSFGTYTEAMADWFETDFAKALGNGTEALPSMAFASDPDTGLYRAGTNQIGASTGGSRRWLLSNTAFQVDVPITGTAVQSGADDATQGRLLKVGAFGLGAIALSDVDAGGLGLATQFARFNSDVPVSGNWHGLHLSRVLDANSAQVAVRDTSGSPQMAFRNRPGGSAGWRPWAELYHKLNILGTVSQSGGVPTGAVIERGSNANGEFVRFADGTMICTAEINGSDTEAATWTFPAAFSTTAGLIPSVQGVSAIFRSGTVTTITTTNLTFSVYNTAGTRTTQPARLSAIGRWF